MWKTSKKFDNISDFLGWTNIHNVLRNFLLYVFRILFNNDPQQISINSAKKWPRKWYRNMNFSLKKCIMEKTHLKFCYIYISNASITQKMRFLYINWFILETCHICMERLIIYLHRNVNNSKFIKTNFPWNSTSTPPLIFNNKVCSIICDTRR